MGNKTKNMLPFLFMGMGDNSNFNTEGALITYSKVNKELSDKDTQKAIMLSGLFTVPGQFLPSMEIGENQVNKNKSKQLGTEVETLKKVQKHFVRYIMDLDTSKIDNPTKAAGIFDFLKIVRPDISKKNFRTLPVYTEQLHEIPALVKDIDKFLK